MEEERFGIGLMKRCTCCGRLIATHTIDEARWCLDELAPAPTWFESCPLILDSRPSATAAARPGIQSYAMDDRD